MTRQYPPTDIMVLRMKPLSRRHRLAHLRALLDREPDGSIRRIELFALLRRQMPPQPANENRAP